MSSTASLENTLFRTVFALFKKTVRDTNCLNHEDTFRPRRVPERPPSQTVFLSPEGAVPDGSSLSSDPSSCVLRSAPEVRHA